MPPTWKPPNHRGGSDQIARQPARAVGTRKATLPLRFGESPSSHRKGESGDQRSLPKASLDTESNLEQSERRSTIQAKRTALQSPHQLPRLAASRGKARIETARPIGPSTPGMLPIGKGSKMSSKADTQPELIGDAGCGDCLQLETRPGGGRPTALSQRAAPLAPQVTENLRRLPRLVVAPTVSKARIASKRSALGDVQKAADIQSGAKNGPKCGIQHIDGADCGNRGVKTRRFAPCVRLEPCAPAAMGR